MTSNYQPITAAMIANFDAYKGAKVRFYYGAMCGEDEATIIDYAQSEWGDCMIAETEAGERKSISGFTTIGIGVYLLPNA